MKVRELFQDPAVKAALYAAWLESKPGKTNLREEGGFVILNERRIDVALWPHGSNNEIQLPDHSNCRFRDQEIIASFHTHPNTGSDFEQEPSITDIRAVRDDPDLKGENYLGEFVISCENIYLIGPDGKVRLLCSFDEYFEDK